MASITRSTRRAEGLHHHRHPPPHHPQPHSAAPLAPRPGPGAVPAASLYQHDGRQKRGLDASGRDPDAPRAKRTRIAVEIVSQPASDAVAAGENRTRPPRPASLQHHQQHHQQQQQRRPLVATGVAGGGGDGNNNNYSSGLIPVQSIETPIASHAPPRVSEAAVTKHKAKVINGIKHELDRLQPQSDGPKDQGRKLRSQEATRFKSELSAYFPDYDEVIGNDPKEQHLLNVDTPIVVVDSDNPRVGAQGASHVAPRGARPLTSVAEFPVKGYGDALYTDVFDSQRIDFRFLETQQTSKNLEDPLPDALFEPVHKKAERVERSIRNSEKGRAQHEKDQIARLLDGLQGHDWLRVMGVSGVTETKKKAFEPARAHFIKGCQVILDKFRHWSQEEKRRKQEKERALAEQAAEDEKRERQEDRKGGERDTKSAGRQTLEDDSSSQGDASEASSPAQQLRQEAMARSQMAATAAAPKRPRAPARPVPPKPPEPPREFKSFFSKRYERDGAVHRNRRTARKVLAWGHPVPDMDEVDFELPEEYRDEETLKARARKKRRDKRGKKN
ncbi:hypothetical protein HIM_08982 [Hirsutella minnesotensis 3608]|uniref:Something about silencing protein 4 domain-containing protein n=1 Tax=Hirsutella minnesotensis 3608 TaxID=1043627 RepID=A0A0F7ZSL8_9HYPO|nr:hypothetical protein HIM_08982 [Hirsutella minnesotensis 3608]